MGAAIAAPTNLESRTMSKRAEQALADAVDELRAENPNVDNEMDYWNGLNAKYLSELFPTVNSPMELNQQQLDQLTAAVGAGMVALHRPVTERRVAKRMYFYYMSKLDNAGNLSAAVRESFAIKALKWAKLMGEDA